MKRNARSCVAFTLIKLSNCSGARFAMKVSKTKDHLQVRRRGLKSYWRVTMAID
jgi:hypothetical protein